MPALNGDSFHSLAGGERFIADHTGSLQSRDFVFAQAENAAKYRPVVFAHQRRWKPERPALTIETP